MVISIKSQDLKALIKATGLSRNEVAKKIGLKHRSSLDRWFITQKISSKYYSKILKLVSSSNNKIIVEPEAAKNILKKSINHDSRKSKINSGANFIDSNFGNFIFLGNEPGTGKTKLVTSLVKDYLDKNNHQNVVWFSLDESLSKISSEFLSLFCNLPSNDIYNSNLSNEQITKLQNGSRLLSEKKIYFDDTKNLSIIDIINKIDTLLSSIKEIGLVVIDYLQLINIEDEIKSEVFLKKLKNYSIEKNLKMIIISQTKMNNSSKLWSSSEYLADYFWEIEKKNENRVFLKDTRKKNESHKSPTFLFNDFLKYYEILN